MGGEGMAEQVRMDSFRLEPSRCRELAEDQERAGAGEPARLGIQETLRAVPGGHEPSSPSKVTPQCLRGLPTDRDDSLLRAFADTSHDACVEIDARLLQSYGLADPEPGAVEEFDESAGAQ